MRYVLLISLLALFATPAQAQQAGLTKLQFKTVECTSVNINPPQPTGDTLAAPQGMTGTKIECKPQDLQEFPFLHELTKNQIAVGEKYVFNITRVQDTATGKPYLIVNMQNAMIYSVWGTTGAYGIYPNGSYFPIWRINSGMAAYTRSCPGKFSYILPSDAKKPFSEWAYDGKDILHLADYDTVESIPACQ